MCYYGNMKDMVINVYKNKGETPLECINNIKKNNEKLRFLPMTYAGRLDPLAEGVLLILVGDECLKKDEYLKLPKVYEVDVLFGFSTDTYDVMGKIIKDNTTAELLFKRSLDERDGDQSQTILNSNSVYIHKLQNILSNFVGNIEQSYPPYSSRPVNGKPLFAWAREGKLSEIEIPKHKVVVGSIDILEERKVKGKELIEKIKEDISLVKGDFRQKEILSLWNKKLSLREEDVFPIIKLRISCGSGVYVRVIANDIGKELGITSLALNIKRVKVGEYEIN